MRLSIGDCANVAHLSCMPAQTNNLTTPMSHRRQNFKFIMKQFLKVSSSDKFSDIKKKTTTTDRIYLSGGVGFNLRHISFDEIEEVLVIDVFYSANQSAYMLGLNNGTLILNINNSKNIELEAEENYTDSSSINNATVHFESVYFEISKDILAEICEAKSLEMKIIGSNRDKVLKGEKFLNYCRKFYNQFYDNKKYPETADMKIHTLWDKFQNWSCKLFGIN